MSPTLTQKLIAAQFAIAKALYFSTQARQITQVRK